MATDARKPIYGEYIPLERRIEHQKRLRDERRAWLEKAHSHSPRCQYCGIHTSLEPRGFNHATQHGPGSFHATLDHAVPLSRGGKDKASNYRLACYTCNLLKADMGEVEYKKFLKAEGVI